MIQEQTPELKAMTIPCIEEEPNAASSTIRSGADTLVAENSQEGQQEPSRYLSTNMTTTLDKNRPQAINTSMRGEVLAFSGLSNH